MSGKEQCKKCVEEISTDATKCPQCGYEPKTEGYYGRLTMMLVGFALTATIIGALLGLPLLYLGYKSQKKHEDMKPTTESPN